MIDKRHMTLLLLLFPRSSEGNGICFLGFSAGIGGGFETFVITPDWA